MGLKNALLGIEKNKVARIVLAAILCIFACKLVFNHIQIISAELPLEYREAHIPSTTHVLINGGNPFDLEAQPQFTNVYGIFFSYVCYPIVKLFGDTFPVYRAIAGVFILLCCGLLYWMLRRNRVPILLSLAGSLVFYASLLYFVTPMVRPDSFGLFLFMIALFLPGIKNHSRSAMFLSVLCTLVAFYSKTYFLLAGPFVGSHIFFTVSKRKGLEYTAMFIGLMALSIFLFDSLYETYFSNVFFIYTNYHIDDMDFLFNQIKSYSYHSSGLLSGLILVAGIAIYKKKNPVIGVVNLKDINKPLFTKGFSLLGYVIVLTIFLFLYRMGQHTGAWLTYLFQLVSPFLILYILKNTAYSKAVHPVMAILLVINLYIASFPFLETTEHVNKSSKEWALLNSIIKPHKTILNAPMFAMDMLRDGKNVYDSGNSEYFRHGGDRTGIWSFLSEPQNTIDERYKVFMRNVTDSIVNKKFDLIALARGPRFQADEREFMKQYTLLITIPIHMPHAVMNGNQQRFDIGIWEPKGKERALADKYALYDALYKCNPDDFHINYYIGMQLYQVQGDFQKAVFFLERAVSIETSDALIHNILGSIYFTQLKQYSKALEHFLGAYALTPNDQSVIQNVGYTYRQIGDEANAKRFLDLVGLQ